MKENAGLLGMIFSITALLLGVAGLLLRRKRDRQVEAGNQFNQARKFSSLKDSTHPYLVQLAFARIEPHYSLSASAIRWVEKQDDWREAANRCYRTRAYCAFDARRKTPRLKFGVRSAWASNCWRGGFFVFYCACVFVIALLLYVIAPVFAAAQEWHRFAGILAICLMLGGAGAAAVVEGGRITAARAMCLASKTRYRR